MRFEPRKPSEDLPKASRWNLIFMKRTNRLAMGIFLAGVVYYVVTRLLLQTYP